MTSSDWDLTFTWSSPDHHMTFRWPLTDPYLILIESFQLKKKLSKGWWINPLRLQGQVLTFDVSCLTLSLTITLDIWICIICFFVSRLLPSEGLYLVYHTSVEKLKDFSSSHPSSQPKHYFLDFSSFTIITSKSQVMASFGYFFFKVPQNWAERKGHPPEAGGWKICGMIWAIFLKCLILTYWDKTCKYVTRF